MAIARVRDLRNHFHLAVETPEPNLSLGMKWLPGTWALRFNRYGGENGRPFQGRYKALHVEPGHALAQVAHYIHLNPVRAGVVLSEQMLDFRPSSLRWFRHPKRPKFLGASTLLAESGELPIRVRDGIVTSLISVCWPGKMPSCAKSGSAA